MELKDTANLMLSNDYKDRFRAEYYQLKIRHDKLESMLKRHEEGTLDFTPTCPIAVLSGQLLKMKRYMEILRLRASLENIVL